MEAKDSRIGNWVSGLLPSDDEMYPCEFQISAKGILSLTTEKYITEETPIDYIPLTEEWLLRFGFYKPAYSWIGDKFHLSEWDDYPLNWCVAFNKNNAILVDKLKYVHQLQNLYFALTGQELEIKTT